VSSVRHATPWPLITTVIFTVVFNVTFVQSLVFTRVELTFKDAV
jgi:hypothetical protein